jgi:nucleotide-binding universal stress UspA family protein
VARSSYIARLHARRALRPGGPSVVLAGYDRGPASDHALSYAAGLTARVGARLVILNVDESLALGLNGLPAPDCTSGLSVSVGEIAEEVRRVVGDCGRFEVAIQAGDPATAIQRVASERHVDLIVVGQSRRRWMHPLGSVPSRLAHHAEQPVLIVP